METDQIPGLGELVAWPFEALAGLFFQIDPQYLLIAMVLLVWLRLGRIARALKSRDPSATDPSAQLEALLASNPSLLGKMSGTQAQVEPQAAAKPRPAPLGQILTARPDARTPASAEPLKVRRG